MTTYTCRLKSYIQPFERVLAIRELTQLAGTTPVQRGEHVWEVSANRPLAMNRLAYWEAVAGKDERSTEQALLESTANTVRNGVPIADLHAMLPLTSRLPVNRRVLRYGVHGIHEYRGKFFPQLVRSLLNQVGAGRGSVVFDPMVGSGTTCVEASLLGARAVGLDLNPLSVLVTHVKSHLYAVDPVRLEASYEQIRSALLRDSDEALTYFEGLPQEDQTYLGRWFSPAVLLDLDRISRMIQRENDPVIRDFFRVVQSNILRRVSWQKVDDLRVRRETKADADLDAIAEYLQELGRSLRYVLAARLQLRRAPVGIAEVRNGDARDAARVWPELRGRVNVTVTSPPYATALPYLDTDRLSLAYLGLLTRPVHRARDLDMIGNREISDRQRRSLLEDYARNKQALPDSVVSLVDRVDELNQSTAGFRRKNMSALLAKYFLDMQRVFTSVGEMMAADGSTFVVVGSNHTIAGGTRIEIETASLLADVAESVGYRLADRLEMEMLVSRDIFRRNAGPTESILHLVPA